MKKRANGFTLVELIVAITIMAIITPVMSMVLFYVIKGFSSYEAINSINKKNQEMLNRIYMRISVNKRIFQNTSSDNQFLLKVQLTNCPPVLSGSKLAKLRPVLCLLVHYIYRVKLRQYLFSAVMNLPPLWKMLLIHTAPPYSQSDL